LPTWFKIKEHIITFNNRDYNINLYQAFNTKRKYKYSVAIYGQHKYVKEDGTDSIVFGQIIEKSFLNKEDAESYRIELINEWISDKIDEKIFKIINFE
jgi:vacuolar-type H+-ATPase subunit B/Vma2